METTIKEYKLDNDDIKRLMKYLNLKYHNISLSDGKKLSSCSCGNKGCSVIDCCTKENLSFDSDTEMMMVFRKLNENIQWYNFWAYCRAECLATEHDVHIVLEPHLYTVWLFENPTRFCKLVSEFLKKLFTF